MAKNFIQPGKSIRITGQSSTIAAGSIFRRTGASNSMAKAWIGTVEDEIIGTGADAETLDGRPIQIGDGVAAEAQSGDGIGDMTIEGVFFFLLPTSGMVVNDSDPLYMQVASVTAPGTVASGVTNNQSASFDRHALSGALVGFAVGANYTATTAPYTGLNGVDVKLLGLPLHGLDAVAPSQAS
jgi:predicted RecA/RadA family phage recombinase